MRLFRRTIFNSKIRRANKGPYKLRSTAEPDRDRAAQIKTKATATITDALPLTIVADSPEVIYARQARSQRYGSLNRSIILESDKGIAGNAQIETSAAYLIIRGHRFIMHQVIFR